MRAIEFAVAAQSKSMLAHQMETAAAMFDTNEKMQDSATLMKTNAAKVAAQIKANSAIASICTKLENAAAATKAAEKSAGSASVARYVKALRAVKRGVRKAEAKA